MPDPRSAAAPVVVAFAAAMTGRATGVYVGGSMATGDYRPGISDIDAVALLPAPLTRRDRTELRALHAHLAAATEDGRALHCVYVPSGEVLAEDRRHWTWAHGQLFRRPLSGIARAELLADPIVAFGPAPATWLPAVDAAGIRAAAIAELSGYWSRAVRRRGIWLDDAYVDLGLTVWARADAAIHEGVLVTKREAIERLRGSGLPAGIVDGVAARRAGGRTDLGRRDRTVRADLVREFLARRIALLTGGA